MSSIGLLLAWCPGTNSPCDPCKKPPPGTTTPPGYPNWGALAYDGTVDIRFFYQDPAGGVPFLWGGHTITFGPHSLPDPGAWFQPPYIPPGSTEIFIYYTTVDVYIADLPPTGLPSAPVSGTDTASIQAADQAAQWQGFDYAVAHPPR